MIDEKKLTDEEIVKALECCINDCNCENCPYGNNDDCTANVEDILDLIHRLQDEKKRLTEKFDEKVLREIIAQNCVLNEENAELQKQVDELKERNYWLQSEHEHQCEKSYFEGIEKGSVDTAKKAWDFAKDFFEWDEEGFVKNFKDFVQGCGVEVE